MWRTPTGTRVLTDGEWSYFSGGLAHLYHFVNEDISSPHLDLGSPGVALFDALTPEQKLHVLAEVGLAFRNPLAAPPGLSAAREATVGAILLESRMLVEAEIGGADFRTGDEEVSVLCRQSVLDARPDWASYIAQWVQEGMPEDEAGYVPDPTCRDMIAWEPLIASIEESVLWDADFEEFQWIMDLSPEDAARAKQNLQIAPDYYEHVPEDPDEKLQIFCHSLLCDLLDRGPFQQR